MRSRRILIVDDYPVFARSIRRPLVRAGFQFVEIAVNVEEAWEKLRGFEPNVILMDIDLGERSEGQGQLASVLTVCGLMGKRSSD